MIEEITYENIHLYGSILPEIHRLRHECFVKRQNYDVPSYKGMEYDNYDTPATVYLVWRGNDGKVHGLSRLSPTDRPYMIKDIWPYMITKIPMPNSDKIIESTRFCVRDSLDRKLRKRIIAELVCAGLEYSLKNNITDNIGVMPPLIWKFVFINSGWPIEYIGDVVQLDDGAKVVAARMPVNIENLNNVYEVNGFNNPVLSTADNNNLYEVI